MRIRIIRHGEVDYNWGRKLDSKGYDRSCREYDESPIKDSEKRLILAEGEPIFISSLSVPSTPQSRSLAMRKCTEAKTLTKFLCVPIKIPRKNTRCGSGMFLQGCSGFSTPVDSRKQERCPSREQELPLQNWKRQEQTAAWSATDSL